MSSYELLALTVKVYTNLSIKLHIRVNSIRDVFLELFCDFKMGLFFLAITASIVQRLERLLSFALRRKQVYGELFVSHVFVVGELPNVA